MIRITFAAATAVACLVFTLPASAQGAKTANDTPGTPPAMANGMSGNSMSGNAMTADAMPTTCQGMMDKAHPMMDSMSDGHKKMMATKHMGMANTAMSAGKEKTCMSQMNMAMHDMGKNPSTMTPTHTADSMASGSHAMPDNKQHHMSDRTMPSHSPNCSDEALAKMPPEHRAACGK
jgi:hypothetical protein